MQTEIQVKLRVMRRQFNITQRELGLKVGLTSATISNYEIGTLPSPERTEQLFQAIEHLGKQKISRPELRVV